jgi:hypothetical protein
MERADCQLDQLGIVLFEPYPQHGDLLEGGVIEMTPGRAAARACGCTDGAAQRTIDLEAFEEEAAPEEDEPDGEELAA